MIYRKRTSSSVWPSPIGNTFAEHVPFLLWSGSSQIGGELGRCRGEKESAGEGVDDSNFYTLRKYSYIRTYRFFKDVCFVRSLAPNCLFLGFVLFFYIYSCVLHPPTHAHMPRLVYMHCTFPHAPARKNHSSQSSPLIVKDTHSRVDLSFFPLSWILACFFYSTVPGDRGSAREISYLVSKPEGKEQILFQLCHKSI